MAQKTLKCQAYHIIISTTYLYFTAGSGRERIPRLSQTYPIPMSVFFGGISPIKLNCTILKNFTTLFFFVSLLQTQNFSGNFRIFKGVGGPLYNCTRNAWACNQTVSFFQNTHRDRRRHSPPPHFILGVPKFLRQYYLRASHIVEVLNVDEPIV